ncbi:DUF3068 domain-containing protein [Streptomyces sp. N2-109]|uniref:DUF3068 domain-containing protein n=1 Tax=Streptomyces gossypii TaxID=2883101 RepID=A0ABT2JQV5_9ACTN|nr:DUF3068 domain-containing protein [Streptomyces gossypii]MCT2590278.1 DUF3068 domain-containing protein [Streptomyces gossypii]
MRRSAIPSAGQPSPPTPPRSSARRASPLSLVLLGLGVFLLVLAPLLAWYVEPRAKRTPIDINSTTVMTGTGSYFDQETTATKEGEKLTVTRRVLGDVAKSEEDDVAVWNVSQTIDNPKTLKLDDPRRSFQWKKERWVTDRKTNRPVHCCDESPGAFAGEGYLKFPFDMEERGYTWWDSTLGDTVPLRFEGRKKVAGYEGMHYKGSVKKQVKVGIRQVPAVLVDDSASGQMNAEEWYSNEEIHIIADERTGRIIYASIAPKLALRPPGGDEDKVTLLQSDKIEFTEKTSREQVELARDDSDRLKLVGETLPVAGAAVGGLLAAAGAVLVVRGRRGRGLEGHPDGENAPRSAM